MRHLRSWDLDMRLCTFPGGQNLSFPDPVLRNLFATAFTVFILPILLCFTTVLTGTSGNMQQPFSRGEREVLCLSREEFVGVAGVLDGGGVSDKVENCLQRSLLASLLYCKCGLGKQEEMEIRGWVNQHNRRLLATRTQVETAAISRF